MTPKLSIIIPVYNTEIYLKECLDSIINQTFKDIEIIIVNDCSPDNSETIILEYASKDPRIKYIKHDKNKSLLQARISGAKIATGDYFWHVDSDDYLPTLKACEILVSTINSTQAEVIQFEVKLDKNDSRHWFRPPISTKLLSNSNEISQLFFIDLIIGHTVWHRIIKRELFIKSIENIPQDIYINVAEDFFLCSFVMNLATSYTSIKNQLYFYRKSPDSITYASVTLKQVSICIDNFKAILGVLAKKLSPKHMKCVQHTLHLTRALALLEKLLIQDPFSVGSVLNVKKLLSTLEFTYEELLEYPILFYIYTTEKINDNSVLFLLQLQKLLQEKESAQYDKWYHFGQLSRKQKIKKIIIVISKKLKIYPILKYMYKIVRK